jgi:hypothetical protein
VKNDHEKADMFKPELSQIIQKGQSMLGKEEETWDMEGLCITAPPSNICFSDVYPNQPPSLLCRAGTEPWGK